jgi:hypothetical protein
MLKTESFLKSRFVLYKIYYDDILVYVGRTKQPINQRLWGHFSAKPMHKKIDVSQVSKIEVCCCNTEADMFLYEIYYINKLCPVLNCDDKAKDGLTVSLPELEFISYMPDRMDIWKQSIVDKDRELKLKKELEQEDLRKKRELRIKARNTMSREDYLKWLDDNAG